MVEVHGTTSDKFSGVRDVFAANLARGADIGASVAVFHNEELVVDLWGGFRDEAKTVPWTKDTLVNVWSTTKTMTFLVTLMLVDQGLLDPELPVAHYWPEFAENGKSDILVRHLLCHSAGLSGWEGLTDATVLGDWEASTSWLARQAPWWSERDRSGYHAISQGHLIGEVVRRVTGSTIGQWFKSEVADVLGADFFIGLPESEEDRVSLVSPPGSAPDLTGVDLDGIAVRTFTSPLLDATLPHHRWWRAAEIPAAGGHGNALSVAQVQQIIANNGHAQGHRFFSEKTGERIFQQQTFGVDLVLGTETNFGWGYGLTSPNVPIGSRACYWGGYGGSLIIMDQESKLTVSYMMNNMLPTVVGDDRGNGLAFAAAMAALS